MNEDKLFQAAYAGDIQARNRIVEHFSYLPGMVLRKWRNPIPSSIREDLVQEGMLGVLQASVRFDPYKGVDFFERYARHYVEHAFHHYLTKMRRYLNRFDIGLDEQFDGSVPAPQLEDAIHKEQQACLRLYIDNLPQPYHRYMRDIYTLGQSKQEIAQELGISPLEIHLCRQRCLRNLRKANTEVGRWN